MPTTDQKLYLSKQLIRAGQLLEIADLVLFMLCRESFVSGNQKQALKSISTNIKQALRRYNDILTPDSQLAKQDVLTEEKVVHVCGVIDCLAQLPAELTDSIAEYVFEQYKAYMEQEPVSEPISES